MISFTEYTIQELLERAAAAYKELPAVSFVDGDGYSYSGLLEEAKAASSWLLSCGFFPGDKCAILGENSPNWGLAYMALNRAGCVTVPILPDFSDAEIAAILTHAEVKGLFVSERSLSKIQKGIDTSAITLFNLDSMSVIGTSPSKAADFKGSDGKHESRGGDLATIIYTSGTTGQSKGVMLTNKNLIWNAEAAVHIPKLKAGYKLVSILPLSHTYEFTIGFLTLLISGTSLYYLRKPPAASVLLPALKKIRPEIMVSVPLLIEKIYRQNILAKFTKGGLVSSLYRTTAGRKILNRVAGKKLMKLFGGRLVFFGIGGAPLSPDVEDFLIEAKFPYAIGYGLTETSPLIAGSNPQNTVPRAIGPLLPGLEVEIRDPHPQTGEGVIFVKGPNVMQGYYKEEEKTREVLSEDGWFNTGDLGILDNKGNLFIKGRAKTMILGPSGENIYPEHIEAMIDRYEFIEESLVLEDKGTLVAMIRINYEALNDHLHHLADKAGDSMKNASDHAGDVLENLKKELNKQLSRFSRIGTVIEQKEPFLRTPTKKIKRYIYQALHHGQNPPGENPGPQT